MKYVMTVFWAIILGQVAGFIGSALTHGKFDSMLTLIISIIFGIIVTILPLILQNSSPAPEIKDK
ncbi:hypothetical protein RD055328_06710 [Companilactobacillus sp. RD055328]|uniref:YjzD family protein n=1 Tax=Companilactobacillus sp. RD055328 TaxID=2916634 RepID=UPI001FC7CF8B|nr:YjzD family protein [Companilactobacillus sp. RD055328]GKQ42748.1 hypothetical protein RD055328_06710 [Companilactobacillus sp. RD055328]